MAENNSWTGYEHFCSLKPCNDIHRTNAKLFLFVLSFDSDKEGNDPVHSRPSSCFFLLNLASSEITFLHLME